MSATLSPGQDLQQDILQLKMGVVVHLIQPAENHRFTAPVRLKSATSAWKVCRREWQVKPEWLLLWREVWFLSNPKDCTITPLGMVLSPLFCFFSNFTPLQKEKRKRCGNNLWGFKVLLAILNYAWRKHMDSFSIWEGCSSQGTDFCVRIGTSD